MASRPPEPAAEPPSKKAPRERGARQRGKVGALRLGSHGLKVRKTINTTRAGLFRSETQRPQTKARRAGARAAQWLWLDGMVPLVAMQVDRSVGRQGSMLNSKQKRGKTFLWNWVDDVFATG